MVTPAKGSHQPLDDKTSKPKDELLELLAERQTEKEWDRAWSSSEEEDEDRVSLTKLKKDVEYFRDKLDVTRE